MGWNLIAFSALLLLILTYHYFLWYHYHTYWYSRQFLDMNLIQMSEHHYECDVNGICNITATISYPFDDTSQSHGFSIPFLPYTSLSLSIPSFIYILLLSYHPAACQSSVGNCWERKYGIRVHGPLAQVSKTNSEAAATSSRY